MNGFNVYAVFSLIFLIYISQTLALNHLQKREASNKDPSLEIATHDKCQEIFRPIIDDLKIDESSFDQQQFCMNFTQAVSTSCETSLLEKCKKAPWKFVRVICKSTVSWFCD